MKWGLVPHWAKDESIGNKMINARAETLAEKRSFKNLLASNRCLVLADGFYEWRHGGAEKEKTPYFIRLRSRRPFAFAGVWERWKPTDGAPLVSCAIVTCAANAVVAPIHARMPVIVPPAARDRWVGGDEDGGDLASLLRPYPEDEMEAYPVSRLVNAPRNDVPECIAPLDPPGAWRRGPQAAQEAARTTYGFVSVTSFRVQE
jgi:putative SOS response-associated peptidase YedK